MVRANNLLMIKNTLSCAKAPVSPGQCVHSMNTPFIPHIYIAKLGFIGIYIYYFSFGQNIACGYSPEPPRRGSSNVYSQFMF